jgi:hypothetical protein
MIDDLLLESYSGSAIHASRYPENRSQGAEIYRDPELQYGRLTGNLSRSIDLGPSRSLKLRVQRGYWYGTGKAVRYGTRG